MPISNFDHIMDAIRAQRPGTSEDLLREALEEAVRASPYLGSFFPGSIHYQRHGFNDIPGQAFSDRDFGRWQGKTKPPNPERDKALATCRDLKRLRDGTTFEGERSNAQAAMDRLCAKHGIGEREI